MRALIALITAGAIVAIAVFVVVRVRDAAPELGEIAAAQSVATEMSATGGATSTATAAPKWTTYTSPDFGYAISYDKAAWSTSTSQVTATMDGVPVRQNSLELRHTTVQGTLRLVGEAGWYGGSSASMTECRDDLLRSFTIWDQLTPLATPTTATDDRRAWIQADFVIDGVPTTGYFECRWLGGDDVTLKVTQIAPTASVGEAEVLRETVLAGLDMAGMRPALATPMATPLFEPLAAATPMP